MMRMWKRSRTASAAPIYTAQTIAMPDSSSVQLSAMLKPQRRITCMNTKQAAAVMQAQAMTSSKWRSSARSIELSLLADGSAAAYGLFGGGLDQVDQLGELRPALGGKLLLHLLRCGNEGRPGR